jgi:putative Ca2+/H+ antiporter (TMEM165/GDT1 family)
MIRFDPALFASTFALIFVAELPDKTAFAALLLATRKNPFAVFLGAAVAFLIQTLVAVGFGSVLGLLPHAWVELAAAVLFFAFAGFMWRRDSDPDEAPEAGGSTESFARAATSSFLVIFIAEWGDLTQLATATLSAQHREPLTIFVSAILALWSVTALAIGLGNRAKRWLRPALLKRIAAIAFVVVGLFFLFQSVKHLT